jgi:hypothetical protein
MDIKYDRYLIAFLDILGFKQVCKVSNETEGTSKLNEIYEICFRSIENLKNIDGKKEIKSFIISDSIILGMALLPGREKFTAREVADFLLAVGRIQFDLFKAEILLRGGISVGKAYFDLKRKIVVGPAFVDAYELESKGALYPRVIVTPKLINELELQNQVDLILSVNEEYKSSKQRALFNWDSHGDGGLRRLQKDVPFFVDFLRSNEGDISAIRKRCDDTVHLINKMALIGIEHYSKYKWLEDYWLTTYGQALGCYDGKTVLELIAIQD